MPDTVLRSPAVQSAPPVSTPTDHIAPLDGLRGLAVLLVMVYHFADLVSHSGINASGFEKGVLRLCGAGWVGVDLFFVLSGYLITGILTDTRGHQSFFLAFYMRRSLRIFPLYYGILLALLVILPLAWTPSSPAYRFLQENQWCYWSYLTNAVIAANGTFTGFTGGFFWSLAVEEQFYLFWPLLVYCLTPRAMLRACVGLLAASIALRVGLAAAGFSPTALYVLPFTRLDPLVVGAFLALAHRDSSIWRLSGRWLARAAWLALASIAVLFLWKGRFPFWDRSVVALGLTPLAIMFGYALVGAVTAPAGSLLYRFWTMPLLVSLGRYSYAIYLFHVAAGYAVKEYVLDPVHWQSAAGSLLLPLLVYLLLASAASWLLGFLSWHCYEKHFLGLKKYFRTTKVAERPPAATAVSVVAARQAA